MPVPAWHNPIRRGVTLIELLVVVTILMLLAAYAVPKMRPAMEDRNVREAARAVNVYLGSARIRAIETGLPCGVLLERNELEPHAATVLHQVELPPPYAGSVSDAVVRLQIGGQGLKLQIRAGDFDAGLIRRGDLIQLNHQGPLCRIIDHLGDNDPANEHSAPDGGALPGRDFPCDPVTGFIDFNVVNNTYTDPELGITWVTDPWLSLEPTQPGSLPWPSAAWSEPVAFKIYRQPDWLRQFDPGSGSVVSTGSVLAPRSAAPPLRLPRGTVVDLRFSGIGPGLPPDQSDHLQAHDWDANTPGIQDPSPVIVIFAPNGSVQTTYHTHVVDPGPPELVEYHCHPLVQPWYLLVGKWKRVVDPGPEDGLKNWQDLKSLWVALNPYTGLVTVAKPRAEPGHVNAAGISRPVALYESRRSAREAQISKGGR